MPERQRRQENPVAKQYREPGGVCVCLCVCVCIRVGVHDRLSLKAMVFADGGRDFKPLLPLY